MGVAYVIGAKEALTAYLDNWSFCMHTESMASLSDCGLNKWMALEISGFNPPIKVPTNVFYVQPQT